MSVDLSQSGPVEADDNENLQDLIDTGFRQAKVSLTSLVTYMALESDLVSSQHCAIVYVSTDAKLEEMQAATHNKPYLSMVFQDGSDFAPMVRSEEEMKAAVAEVSDVARDEWFVSAEVSLRAVFPKRW